MRLIFYEKLVSKGDNFRCKPRRMDVPLQKSQEKSLNTWSFPR